MSTVMIVVMMVIPAPSEAPGEAKSGRVIGSAPDLMMVHAESMFAEAILVQIEG
jgi:hypothetical protein